jgi:hypothetical protein
MFKALLSTAALSVALATAVAAQDAPPAGSEAEPPLIQGAAAEPGGDALEAPDAVADDPAPQEPEVAEESPAQDRAFAGDDRADIDVAAEGAADGPALDLAGAMPGDLIGSDVRNFDDERIARVEDVVTDAAGEVETIIVRFGGFLGLGQTTVALLPDEVEVTREDDDFILRTALTAEDLRDRPAHEE